MGASCTKETGVTGRANDLAARSVARTSLDGNGSLAVATPSSNPGASHQAGSQSVNVAGIAPDSSSKRSNRFNLIGRLKSSRSKNDSEGPPAAFVHFSLLSDDVILFILSYVSYAPTELDISGTMTLSMLENPSSYRNRPEMVEARRLLQDYNLGANKLDKVLSKAKSMPPFRPPLYYINETFHSQKDKSIQSRVNSPRIFGTLTHVLPLVNKRIYRLCNEFDVLWKESLQRMLLRRNWYSQDGCFNDLFEKGVISFIKSINDEVNRESSSDEPCNEDNNDQSAAEAHEQDLRERAQAVITKVCLLAKDKGRIGYTPAFDSDSSSRNGALLDNCPGGVARHVLGEVLVNHKPTRLPVFVAPYRLTLGKPIELHLYENRYQLLITELMAGRHEREQKAFPISEPRPRFLFSCRPHMEVTAACIVEVRKCLIRRDGTADIMLVPISWVLLDKMWVRPDSGSLRDGIVTQRPKRTRLPVFHMRRAVTLSQPIGFRFFEPRYQMLVAELMSGRPDNERDGSNLSEPLPQFVYACTNPLEAGNTACIVEVRQCLMHPDGKADVTVVPRCWVLIEELTLRPYFRGLVDATVLYP